MKQLIVYTEHVSKRCEYIVSFLFQTVLGLDYILTDDELLFNQSGLLKLNYSSKSLQSNLQIIPYGLLQETTIEQQTITVEQWNELPCFFKTSHHEFSFDLLSASFYLVSRYEEYLPYMADKFGRFPVENSVAYQYDFLNKPLIDCWMQALKNSLLAKKPELVFEPRQFAFVPTYDIDIAYSYKGKGFARNALGAMRDVLHGNFAKIKERLEVLLDKQVDPYDSFNFLDDMHARYNLDPIYFFLVSDGGALDKNIDPDKPLMKELIQRIETKYKIGIHPSVSSHESQAILQKEIARIGSDCSRQHYIKFTLPGTFARLIVLGIMDDYSMGYGTRNGFRASTSFAHTWFDVAKNEVTPLTLHPFCFMECNSFFMQHDTPDEALQQLQDYTKEVKAVGGQLITIWHNFSLGTEPSWTGWREMYEDYLNSMKD